MSMKILILSPHYFPYINPRAHRWTSIAEYWAKEGHEVHVICSKNKNRQKKEKLNEVHIHRTGFNSPKEVLYYFFTDEAKRGEAGQKKQNAGKKGALMQWVHDKILRNFYFPDDAFIWYYPAKKLMKKLLKEENFDLLISSSVPFTTHLVALNAKKNNPELKWIADTGDPFAFQPLHPMNNYFVFGKLNKKLERRVAESANFVTLTNEGARKLYSDIFPEELEKFVLIYPLCRSSVRENSATVGEAKGETRLKIGYFGSFFKKIREPRPVLEFWSQFLEKYPSYYERLELHFYGNIFENFLVDFEAFPNLKKVLHFHGMLSSKKAAEEMQSMNILLNVGNATNFQLASKSVDYLMSRKPIINFVSIPDDTFSTFFKGYEFFEDFNVYEVGENLARLDKFIRKEYSKEEKEKLDKLVSERILEFQVESISKKYLDLF